MDDEPSGRDGRRGRHGDRLVTETSTVGRYGRHSVQFAAHREPAQARAPDEFGANLFVPGRHGDDVDVFRVDTGHAGCHADRFYLPEGRPERRRDYGVEFYSPEEVLDHLLENQRWRTYLERYDRNHGLPDPATGCDE